MRGGALALSMALAIAACGKAPAAPSSAAQSASLTYDSANFHFEYPEVDSTAIARRAEALEAERARVIQDVGVDAMPRVSVTYYTNHDRMAAAVASSAGPIPSWAGGLVTGVDRIHLMSPTVSPWQSADGGISDLVHEFAHCVSLRRNPAIANNPRWLWEAVAVYESGQRVAPTSLGYMRALDPPSFTRLSSFENTLIYEVGYTIAEYVVDGWGRDGLGRLISANGDTGAALRMSQADFEQGWFGFVRQRYGL